MPYEALRRYECVVGSTPWAPTKLPSVAYWPADAPTCQEASTAATPARTRPSEEVAGPAATSAVATATVSRAIERDQIPMASPLRRGARTYELNARSITRCGRKSIPAVRRKVRQGLRRMVACLVIVLPARSIAVTATLARSRLPRRIARFNARFCFLEIFSGSVASTPPVTLRAAWV